MASFIFTDSSTERKHHASQLPPPPGKTTPSGNNITQQSRAVFLSDIHLGSKDCKAGFLISFLRSIRTEYLFLVGDVVDLWSLKKQSYWPASHQAVLKELNQLSARGTQVIYIPGNHDEALRDFTGASLFRLTLVKEYEYTSKSGKRLLLIHGDEFDSIVMVGRFTNWLGDRSYGFLLWINRWGNLIRQWFGFPYLSIASYIKNHVSSANKAVDRFERAAAHEASRRGLDGIVCGHIHVPKVRQIDGVLYMNDGDWVENCTFLVEHLDGSFELMHWSDYQHQLGLTTNVHKAA